MDKKELELIIPSDILNDMYEWIHKHKLKDLMSLYSMFLLAKLNDKTKRSFCDWFTKRYNDEN